MVVYWFLLPARFKLSAGIDLVPENRTYIHTVYIAPPPDTHAFTRPRCVARSGGCRELITFKHTSVARHR